MAIGYEDPRVNLYVGDGKQLTVLVSGYAALLTLAIAK